MKEYAKVFIGTPICEAFSLIEQQPNIYDMASCSGSFEVGYCNQFPRSRISSSIRSMVTAVYALFGPTFPGIYDKDRGVYILFYPGLSFAFPIPSQYTNCCHEGEAELPLELTDGTTPVKLGEELHFTVGGQHIPFGASPHDVWTELGRPCGVHQKQVDQMVMHSASEPHPKTTLCGDYFYNYFTRGLDILFDGQTHRTKKFGLHTNYPGHADFTSYIKCNFVIHESDFESSFEELNGDKKKITPSTKWDQVKRKQVKDLLQEILGDCGRAAIQTQGSGSDPVVSTFVYGYQNIAF